MGATGALRLGTYARIFSSWHRRTNIWRKVTSPVGTGHATKGRHFAMCRLKPSRTLFMGESIDRLRSHFGLTPAEARLALHLVTGQTLRSAAAKLSISYETARTHLKNIFKKTGTCRQTQLVIVVLTVLPDSLNAAPS